LGGLLLSHFNFFDGGVNMSDFEMPEERKGFVVVKLKDTFAYLSKADFDKGGWKLYKEPAKPKTIPTEDKKVEVKPDVVDSGRRQRTK